MKLAWYSAVMDSHFGHAIYNTTDGQKVKVTTVVDTDHFGENYAGSSHGDELRVGEVTSIAESLYRGFYNEDSSNDRNRNRRNDRGGRRPTRGRRGSRARRES